MVASRFLARLAMWLSTGPGARTLSRRPAVGGLSAPRALRVLHALPLPPRLRRALAAARARQNGRCAAGFAPARRGFKHGASARTLSRRPAVGGLSALRALRVLHALPLPPRLRRALAAARARQNGRCAAEKQDVRAMRGAGRGAAAAVSGPLAPREAGRGLGT
jgi:hypothetical protein